MMLWNRPTLRVVSCCALLWLAGCGTSPYQDWTQALTLPPGTALPVKARLAVAPDPGMPQTGMFGEWSWPDTQLMQQAALNTFNRVFSDAGPPPTVPQPGGTIVLKGNITLNPTLNEYYAKVTGTLFAGADTYAPPLGVFTGEGKASQPDYARSGVLRAYEAAFEQMSSKMVSDPKVLARIQTKAPK